MKSLKICIIVICVLGLLAACSKQNSKEGASGNNLPQYPSSEGTSGNSSSGNNGNSNELGPNADKEATMPDTVQ